MKLENKFKIQLSDHAIARYYERVCGLNKKELHNLIVDNKAMQSIENFGDGVYKSKTHYIVVKNHIVLTVLTERQFMQNEYKEHYKAWLERELKILRSKNRKNELKFAKRAGAESPMTKAYIAGHQQKERDLEKEIMSCTKQKIPTNQ